MKIRPVGAELFHADRQTDRHENLILAFRFCECAYKYAVPVEVEKEEGIGDDNGRTTTSYEARHSQFKIQTVNGNFV